MRAIPTWGTLTPSAPARRRERQRRCQRRAWPLGDGGRAQLGGGILNYGLLTVTDVSVRKNSADAGGGIGNYGTLLMSRSELSYNNAYNGGGS